MKDRSLRSRLWDFGRELLTRVASDGCNHIPLWTPDGQRLVSSSEREGSGANLFWRRDDGTGEMERLTTSELHHDPASWAPDGTILAFTQLAPGGRGSDIWLLRTGGSRRAEPYLQTAAREMEPMISPDGRWLAYTSDESGRLEVYVQPFPAGGRRWQISTAGGREPLWQRDSRELFYREGPRMMAVAVGTGADLNPSKPQVLFEADHLQTTGYGRPNYDVSPDGKRFVMVRRPADTKSSDQEIQVVVNWAEELKRR